MKGAMGRRIGMTIVLSELGRIPVSIVALNETHVDPSNKYNKKPKKQTYIKPITRNSKRW